MFGDLLSKIPSPGKLATQVIIGLAMTAVISVAAAYLAGQVRGFLDDIRTEAKAECNAAWEAKIASSNAQAEAQRAAQAEAAMKLQAAATDRVREAEDKLAQLEKENAALPDNSCGGIGHDRVRLLNRQ